MRWRRLLAPAGLCSTVILIAATQPLVSQCSSSAQAASVGSVSLPGSTTQRLAAIVHYLEQNGFSANAAAGAAGNAMQESSVKPGNPGGGLFANLGKMWLDQVKYDQQHGLDPTSATGQLAYAAFWAKQQSWFGAFNSASSPAQAALYWQNGYEQCAGAGVRGTAQVGGGPCKPAHRQAFAVTAAKASGGSSGSSSSSTSFVSSTSTCMTSASVAVNTKGQTNPAPGASWSRLDMGIDGNYGSKGAVAPFSGTLGCCIGGWPGQGVYFWVVNANQSGPDFTRCMYFAEGATPIPGNGAHVQAGQQIGRPVPHGGTGAPGNFEIGPCNTTTHDTLAKGSSNPKAMVLAFYAWLRKLGAGPATQTSHAGFA